MRWNKDILQYRNWSPADSDALCDTAYHFHRTGHFGKYMNRYEGDHIPAGWSHWSSLILNSKYYNYSMNVNGRRRDHGWRYPQVSPAGRLAFCPI